MLVAVRGRAAISPPHDSMVSEVQVTNRLCLLTFLLVPVLAALAQAQTFTTLVNLHGVDFSNAGVVRDAAGNLYGTAAGGGDFNCEPPNGCGAVFELTTDGTFIVLVTFEGTNGIGPATPVIRDRAGNIYGTTAAGGYGGGGTIFKIDTAGKETVLHNFSYLSGQDCSPAQGLVMDKSGNLFGTTSSSDCNHPGGTIFKIDSAGKFTVLHNFSGVPSDGSYPNYGHLTMDKSGNLYGVTERGGSASCIDWWGPGGCGVLYKLRENGTFALLHSFGGWPWDGCGPMGSVAVDEAGNFYGTTVYCGFNNQGTIWKVTKAGKETILHNFAGGTSDGCQPQAGVTRDSNGDLYGVTDCGGTYDQGTLYELSANGSFTLLHSFSVSEGFPPIGEVLRIANGTIFGTTWFGGTYEGGTVWEYVP